MRLRSESGVSLMEGILGLALLSVALLAMVRAETHLAAQRSEVRRKLAAERMGDGGEALRSGAGCTSVMIPAGAVVVWCGGGSATPAPFLPGER